MPTSPSQPNPWDSPTGAHPEPVPLVSEADLVNPMLKVSDVMSATPRTCSPFSSVVEAVLIFRDADCGRIPGAQTVTRRSSALSVEERGTRIAFLEVDRDNPLSRQGGRITGVLGPSRPCRPPARDGRGPGRRPRRG